jgi:predicted TIM-barrel fold metal-dependent hydrolase
VVTYDLVSADAHILEPPGIWERWLPERFQDAAPQLVEDSEGGSAWLIPGAAEPDPIGLTATPGMAWDQFRWKGVTYEEAREGCYDGAARLGDMDVDGVDAEILFPPQRTIGHFLGQDDEELVLAGVDAYNDFLFDEFCAPDPTRLIGMAQIPSLGIDTAVDTLRKAKARGAKGVVISNWPAGGDSISEEDDEFWAAAQDEDVVVTIHINLTSRAARQRNRAAASGLYSAATPMAGAKAAAGLAGVFSVVPSTIGQLIYTGTFERFPDLHVSMIEIGVGWIPHFLEQMDDRYWRNRTWSGTPITEPPSHYWYRNMSGTFITDRVGVDLRHAVGVDNMMWSTDYPHHGNDWPYSRKTIDDTMNHLPKDEKDKICAGNAARIFKLDR